MVVYFSFYDLNEFRLQAFYGVVGELLEINFVHLALVFWILGNLLCDRH